MTKRYHEAENPKTPRAKKYLCGNNGCTHQTDNKTTATKHQKIHSEEFFVCESKGCDFKTNIQRQYNIHIKKHDKVDGLYVCNFANCTFKTKAHKDLTRHKKTHSDVKEFGCDVEGCTYRSICNDHLMRHKLSHNGEKKHACDFEGCTFVCTLPENLLTHKRTHTGIRPFKCEFEGCGHTSRFANNLKAHELTHTGEGLLDCEFQDCDYQTSVSGNLVRHHRKHTGETRFHCDFAECEYRCYTNSELKSHIITHSQEKTFKCTHCASFLKTLSGLQGHEANHEKQKNYKYECIMQDCGTQIYERGNGVRCSVRCETARHIDYHIQQHHTMEGIGKKLKSETKLAEFFKAAGIEVDRDWVNRLNFKGCKNIEGNAFSARPDFYLFEWSTLLNALVLIGNDEYGHRRLPCEFQRMWNIVQSLQQTEMYRNARILYLRVNPHAYYRGKTLYDVPLATTHQLILQTLRNIDPTTLKDGLNLIYIHYDCDENGSLEVFAKAREEGNDFGMLLEDSLFLSV